MPKPKYTPDQRIKFMLALGDDRISARVKAEIERILGIRTPSELAAARRTAAKADWDARKRGQLSATARAVNERRARAAARQAEAAACRAGSPTEALQRAEPAVAPIARPNTEKPLAPIPPGAAPPIARAAQEAGITAAEIAAHGQAIPQFLEDVFAGKRKPLPWMFEAIEAIAARQAPAQQADAAD